MDFMGTRRHQYHRPQVGCEGQCSLFGMCGAVGSIPTSMSMNLTHDITVQFAGGLLAWQAQEGAVREHYEVLDQAVGIFSIF